MSDLVSVIITCYNLECYIAAAIESVLQQDYAGATEIVVVDDCSSDQSEEIIRSYPQVSYLKTTQNLGVLMATVFGIEHSSGQIILFLDGDDIWESSKLSAVVRAFMADTELALVTHDLTFIDQLGNSMKRASRPAEVLGAAPTGRRDALIRQGILLHSDYVWLGSAYSVHRRASRIKEFCEFAQTLEDPLNTYQDWLLAFWIALQPATKFAYLNEKLMSYRIHGANHSGDARTPEKAIRNIRRARNTLVAICTLGRKLGADCATQCSTQETLDYYTYLLNLYAGHRWAAAVGFSRTLNYLLAGALPVWKELARFFGIQVLGLARFTAIVAKTKRNGT